MNSNSIIMLVTMALYMSFMVGIGVYFANKNKNAADYFLGGRKLGPWVAAMSAEASDMSSWLLMGLPGLAYLTGIADAGWTALGLAVGTYINWKLVAKPLRNYTHICGDSITIPDFFSNRFKDKKRILMTIAALITIVFFVVYTASGFAAAGKLFKNVFGFDYTISMVISAIVIVLYCVMGGFLAASTTDFFQGVLMSITLVIVLAVSFFAAGGIEGIMANINTLPGYASMFHSYNPATGQASQFAVLTIVNGFVWGVGYFGMPHILLRFMAIDSAKSLKRARKIACIWVFISLIAATTIGIIGNTYIKDIPDPEAIFMVLSSTLLPAVFAGLVLSGILAATMSTADSQLLVAASSISQNIYKGIIKKDASEKQVLNVSKITVIIVAIIAAFLALDENSSVFSIVSYAWAGFGASFGPLVLFSIFWKRTTFEGALAGMVGGFATVIIWANLIKPLGGWFGLYELGPAFIISCLLIYIVSSISPEPSKEIQDEFEKVRLVNKED